MGFIHILYSCTDDRELDIPAINGMIVVLQSESPIISLKGTANIARNEHNFIHGQQIFFDLIITATTDAALQETVKGRQRVEGCVNSIDFFFIIHVEIFWITKCVLSNFIIFSFFWAIIFVITFLTKKYQLMCSSYACYKTLTQKF